MKRSTIIGAIMLAALLTIYAVESAARRTETLVIIALMVVGIIVERLFYRRAE